MKKPAKKTRKTKVKSPRRASKIKVVRRCKSCGGKGHNARTCKAY
jgi:hypothetical protein